MPIFESIFDITYLILVIFLGIRLLLEKKSGAKLFGIMAILLGLGDSFHLLPRVISHLSPNGFETYASILSCGQFITSITMTIFYVLFYHYYKNQSGDNSKIKKISIYILAIIRIILVLLPQNNWGQATGNYMFGIYRNIPFAILGILLIYWTYKKRNSPGLKKMSLLIFLSFGFYIPVVIWSGTHPIVGALMLPKTIAYLMIVIFGYSFFIEKFESINILGISFVTLIMGLISGVFYRELTRFYNYENHTHLVKLHSHILVLGFIFCLTLYFITKNYPLNKLCKLKKPLFTYLIGLLLTIVSMTIIGIFEIVGNNTKDINISSLSGISGLGHIILSIGIIWMIITIFNIENSMHVKISKGNYKL